MQRVAAFHQQHGTHMTLWSALDHVSPGHEDTDDALDSSLVDGAMDNDLDLDAFEQELLAGVSKQVKEPQERGRTDGSRLPVHHNNDSNCNSSSRVASSSTPVSHRAEGTEGTDDGNVAPSVHDSKALLSSWTDVQVTRVRHLQLSVWNLGGGREGGGVFDVCYTMQSVCNSLIQSATHSFSLQLTHSLALTCVQATRQLPPVRAVSTPPRTPSSASSSRASAGSVRQRRSKQQLAGSKPRSSSAGLPASKRNPAATPQIPAMNRAPAWHGAGEGMHRVVTTQQVPQLRRARRAQMAKRMRALYAQHNSGAPP